MLQISEQARDEIVEYVKSSTPSGTSVQGAMNLIGFLSQLEPVPPDNKEKECKKKPKTPSES